MSLHGHTKIELFDAKTGKPVKTIEKHNTFTNAVKRMAEEWSQNYSKIFKAYSTSMFPIMNNIGGIFLFENSIDDEQNTLYPPSDNRFTGYANIDSHATTDIKRGNPNVNLQGEVLNEEGKKIGYKFVWDWTAEQGNGTISAISLTTKEAGDRGFGTSTLAFPVSIMQTLVTNGNQSATPPNFYSMLQCKICGCIDDSGYLWAVIPSSQTNAEVYKVNPLIASIGLNDPLYDMAKTEFAYKKYDVTLSADSLRYTSDNDIKSMCFDIGDFILGISNAGANTSGNATVNWFKIKKSDLSTEEGVWTFNECYLHQICTNKRFYRTASSQTTNHQSMYYACYGDGYLYICNSGMNGIYKIDINNITDITLINCANIGTASTYYYYNSGYASGGADGYTMDVYVLKYLCGRVLYSNGYIDAYSSTVTATFNTNAITFANVREIHGTPLFISFGGQDAATSSTSSGRNNKARGGSFGMLRTILFTVNNLDAPVTKTADMTMRITYTIQEA